MNRPAEGLVRRLRELTLLVELAPDRTIGRLTMLTHLRDMLEHYESDCREETRGDQMDRDGLEMEAPPWTF